MQHIVTTRKVDQLQPYPRNARVHSPWQITQIANSIKRWGFTNPVLISKDDMIIAGHGRALAAMQIGMEEIPCIVLPDLSGDELRAYIIADNQLALNASWDDDLLMSEIIELDNAEIELSTIGFSDDDLIRLKGLDGDDNDIDEIEGQQKTSLAERFGVAPFSVLNARDGWWQNRKKAWIGLGIKSERGRGDMGITGGSPLPHARAGYMDDFKNKGLCYKGQKDFNKIMGQKKDKKAFKACPGGGGGGAWINTSDDEMTGTSIFDPVLTELLIRWFSKPGGLVIDPFAGGSVRGIVAAALGRDYVGVELRKEQVEANWQQWDDLKCKISGDKSDTVKIKISASMAKLPFHGCDLDFIKNNCHASCCESSVAKDGVMITIHADEIEGIEARGGTVKNMLLQPNPKNKKCPFKNNDNLCGLHETPDKPFGCIASPFTLNKNNTLIIRNRYKLLKCYDTGKKMPAYIAFAESLRKIFGVAKAEEIKSHFDNGGGDIVVDMPFDSYKILKDNDAIKHGFCNPDFAANAPHWINDDSLNILDYAEDISGANFLLTCPPYADLEVYSDDPRDISTMSYDKFKNVYRDIIKKSCSLLDANSFAAIVVGEVRGKSGAYYNFVGDTIEAFIDAGLDYYNEAILITACGSLPIRAGKSFETTRKLGKTHQNILIFVKGDPKEATKKIGVVEMGDIDAIIDEQKDLI